MIIMKITCSLQRMVTVAGSKNFLDSQIDAKYSQEETKSKYVVQFGLTPFVEDELITDVQKTPYSLIPK